SVTEGEAPLWRSRPTNRGSRSAPRPQNDFARQKGAIRMSDEPKKTVSKTRAAVQEPYPRERETFKSLLLSNPNYFGNLKDSPLKAVLPITGNTFYEELGCVGYHPQQERLEAVVYINQPSGYGTDQCGPGTPEYVRFYLSFDGGATWEDQGITS